MLEASLVAGVLQTEGTGSPIGHLHEAEDESQAWPDLHAAIRAARKAFQTDATIPDWEALAQAAEAVRRATL